MFFWWPYPHSFKVLIPPCGISGQLFSLLSSLRCVFLLNVNRTAILAQKELFPYNNHGRNEMQDTRRIWFSHAIQHPYPEQRLRVLAQGRGPVR